MTAFATFVTIFIFVIGFILLVPKADRTSIQAGITIIAEILGVLLGVLLLVVQRLVDQGQKAVQLMRASYSKYRKLIKSNIKQIGAVRKKLIQLANKGEINLDDSILITPDGSLLETKNRDVVGNLIALEIIMDSLGSEAAEKILDKLAFSKKEMDELLFGKVISVDFDCSEFFKIVKKALNIIVLMQWCHSDKATVLALEIYSRFYQDGIEEALFNLDRSRRVLQSKSLAAGLFFLTTTILIAVMSLFGATDSLVGTLIYTGIVLFVVAGFSLSIIFILILIDKILVRF